MRKRVEGTARQQVGEPMPRWPAHLTLSMQPEPGQRDAPANISQLT